MKWINAFIAFAAFNLPVSATPIDPTTTFDVDNAAANGPTEYWVKKRTEPTPVFDVDDAGATGPTQYWAKKRIEPTQVPDVDLPRVKFIPGLKEREDDSAFDPDIADASGATTWVKRSEGDSAVEVEKRETVEKREVK